MSGLEPETLEIIIDSIFEYENLDDIKKYIWPISIRIIRKEWDFKAN
jgi:hypothetical protein